jgi:hypothetical protein
MDARSYLLAMYDALDELRVLDASEEFDNALALGAYSRYISRLGAITPPGHLESPHSALVAACQVMLAVLSDPAAQERLNAGIPNEDLNAAAEAGAIAARRLQSEADALGLGGLWFT